jgi:uncharacterized protein (DUF1330 family)
MKLTNQIQATRDQFVDFIKNYPKNTPVAMMNTLKFKEKSGNGDETGREAYKRYSKNMIDLLAKYEGKVLWRGNVQKTIIGDSTDQPDMFLVVEYPTAQHFADMSTSPEYQLLKKDRLIALEYGGLIASTSF